MTLSVSEIFYSLQGEGRRAGEPSIFIRLQGCKSKYACAASGIVCDTEFESGEPYPVAQILEKIQQLTKLCKWIVWTGGEPADQLIDDMVAYFKGAGYLQAIETSGLKPVPKGIDWISLSPKVAEHILQKNFETVHELRYVRHAGQAIPCPAVIAKHYFLSPHSDGNQINSANLAHCIELCRQHPMWALSIQQHKLWRVL